MTEEEFRAFLRAKAKEAGSYQKLAEQIGINKSFLGEVIIGGRPASAKILDYYGKRRVVMIEDKPQEEEG